MSVANGDRVRDRITGFQGIVVGITHWATGCVTVAVAAEALHDGKRTENEWIDEGKLELVESGAFTVDDPKETGGPDRHVGSTQRHPGMTD